MAQLIVRELEEKVKRSLQNLAAAHGHSMEQEVRDILRAAAAAAEKPPRKLGSWFAENFKGAGLTEGLPELKGHFVKPAAFDDGR